MQKNRFLHKTCSKILGDAGLPALAPAEGDIVAFTVFVAVVRTGGGGTCDAPNILLTLQTFFLHISVARDLLKCEPTAMHGQGFSILLGGWRHRVAAQALALMIQLLACIAWPELSRLASSALLALPCLSTFQLSRTSSRKSPTILIWHFSACLAQKSKSASFSRVFIYVSL